MIPMADTTSSRTPRQIADAFLDALVARDPDLAVSLGLNLDDDRQPDLSPEGFEAKAELARQALAELDEATGGTDPEDPAEAACARLLRERLTAQLACHDAGDHLHGLNNIACPVHEVRSIFTMMPTATDKDWSVVAGRLRNVGGALQGYRRTLTEGIRRGLFSGPRQVRTVVEQISSWAGEDGKPGWFAQFVTDGPQALRPELDAAAEQAALAAAEFRDWLRDDYAVAAAGASDVAGRDLYLRSARAHTGADLDLDEAYSWAWGEFKRLDTEMHKAAEQVLPGAAPQAAMAHLEEHGHRIKGVENVRQWLQQVMDEAITALDGVHFDLEGPLREVEAMIAPEGSAAAPYYTQPSLDFSRSGRTWLPTLGRDEFPTWQIVSTWYHEGVPGHHLHLTQRMRCADQLSRYQTTIGGVSAEIEGWALYSERFMDELGFFTDPGNRLGFLDEQMLRTIRVIIDIGMHLELEIPADAPFRPGERWTPELADEFFATFNGSPAELRESEIIRYLGWPGQAIGYKLGERAWLRGREAARAAHGADFDLKAWHMKALSQGACGLDELTARLSVL
jgi:uncharacterized protein (DUF885 family)